MTDKENKYKDWSRAEVEARLVDVQAEMEQIRADTSRKTDAVIRLKRILLQIDHYEAELKTLCTQREIAAKEVEALFNE